MGMGFECAYVWVVFVECVCVCVWLEGEEGECYFCFINASSASMITSVHSCV